MKKKIIIFSISIVIIIALTILTFTGNFIYVPEKLYIMNGEKYSTAINLTSRVPPKEVENELRDTIYMKITPKGRFKVIDVLGEKYFCIKPSWTSRVFDRISWETFDDNVTGIYTYLDGTFRSITWKHPGETNIVYSDDVLLSIAEEYASKYIDTSKYDRVTRHDEQYYQPELNSEPEYRNRNFCVSYTKKLQIGEERFDTADRIIIQLCYDGSLYSFFKGHIGDYDDLNVDENKLCEVINETINNANTVYKKHDLIFCKKEYHLGEEEEFIDTLPDKSVVFKVTMSRTSRPIYVKLND